MKTKLSECGEACIWRSLILGLFFLDFPAAVLVKVMLACPTSPYLLPVLFTDGFSWWEGDLFPQILRQRAYLCWEDGYQAALIPSCPHGSLRGALLPFLEPYSKSTETTDPRCPVLKEVLQCLRHTPCSRPSPFGEVRL